MALRGKEIQSQKPERSISEASRWDQERNSRMLLYFLFFITPQLITSFRYHCVCSNLPGVVEIVDEVLDNGGSVGSLDGLVVVGDDSARGGTGNDDTLLTLR